MKIKVCGMKYADNIQKLAALNPDLLGFIFYKKSLRFVGDIPIETIRSLKAKKIGVFVNEEKEEILSLVQQLNLDGVQLHGNESPEDCLFFKKKHIYCIKAFSIENKNDLKQVSNYKGLIDLALFDTKTPNYGGSGKKFDWKILESYQEDIPFLLSGGISIKEVDEIKKIEHDCFYGIDINSKFELQPALKDIDLVREFILKIKNIKNE